MAEYWTTIVEFEEDFEKVKAHVKHEASGYSAAYLRPVMSMIDNEEKKKEILINLNQRKI